MVGCFFGLLALFRFARRWRAEVFQPCDVGLFWQWRGLRAFSRGISKHLGRERVFAILIESWRFLGDDDTSRVVYKKSHRNKQKDTAMIFWWPAHWYRRRNNTCFTFCSKCMSRLAPAGILLLYSSFTRLNKWFVSSNILEFQIIYIIFRTERSNVKCNRMYNF